MPYTPPPFKPRYIPPRSSGPRAELDPRLNPWPLPPGWATRDRDRKAVWAQQLQLPWTRHDQLNYRKETIPGWGASGYSEGPMIPYLPALPPDLRRHIQQEKQYAPRNPKGRGLHNWVPRPDWMTSTRL